MKKIGIWLVAMLAALCLMTPYAYAAQVSDDTQQATTAESADAEETTQDAEDLDTDADVDAQDSTQETEDEDPEQEAEEETEEEAQEPPAVALLNSIELEPRATGDEELDILIEEILDEILTPEMDTYEKVKACYDYLTGNMTYSWSYGRYSKNIMGTTANAMFQQYNTKLYGYGAMALSTNTGQCNDYAAAFILLTRAVGLDTYLVNGKTLSAGGGYIRHYWAEMIVDGERYLFDPQLEQSLGRYSKGPYSVFCKTYAEVGGRYIYSGKA